MSKTLVDIIRTHVHPLVESKTKTNWYNTRCLVCNDHTKKGLRGGFYLEHPNTIGYSCFNCGHTAKYNPTEHEGLSKNMWTVIHAYDIPKSEIDAWKLENLLNGNNDIEKTEKKIEYSPSVIELPEHFYRLDEAEPNDKWAIIANHTLKQRLINPNDYDFYLSTGEGKNGKKWLGRVIIPIYKDRKLIYYHGRSLVPSLTPKYVSVGGDRKAVLYNYDALTSYSKRPIFVTEGFFDAYILDGVAIIGKFITEEQKYWLSKTNREIVVIPDKYGDGIKLVKQALDLGWKISFPNFGVCKDVNEAIIKYGKIFVINELMKSIKSGYGAEIETKLYFNEG